jgi:mRNA interferase HigB
MLGHADHRPAHAARVIDSLGGHKDQPAVKAALDAWFHEVKKAKWSNTAMSSFVCQSQYSHRGAHRLRHQGGGYRLAVAVDFEKSIVWIKWLGTHKDYDKIDVAKVKYAR